MKKVLMTLTALAVLTLIGCGEVSNPTASDLSNEQNSMNQVSSSVNYDDDKTAPVLPDRNKNLFVAEDYDHTASKK